MGCKQSSMPVVNNICESHIGSEVNITGSCAEIGSGGDTAKNNICSMMSRAGEWVSEGHGNGTCTSPNRSTGALCTSGSGPVVGAEVRCKRVSFTGNPINCCMKDYNCNHINQNCFDDFNNSTNFTCDPRYRTLADGGCVDAMMGYCTGEAHGDTPNTNWLERWDPSIPSGCYAYVLKRLSPNHCSPIAITPGVCDTITANMNAAGFADVSLLIKKVMEKYKAMGYEIGSIPGQPSYNAFQDFLYNYICCPIPALCQSALQNECKGDTSQRLQYNPVRLKWCGCHLPSEEYQEYSIKYNIQPQCSSLCNRSDVIKQAGTDLKPVLCTTNSCIIDNVTVNLVNSQIGGGINFSQICGGCNECGGGVCTCNCIISATEVDIFNSQIGGNVIPALNNCGPTSCVQRNPGINGPEYVPVDCNNIGQNIYTEYDAKVLQEQEKATKISVMWTVIICGILLLILFAVIWLTYPTYNKQ